MGICFHVCLDLWIFHRKASYHERDVLRRWTGCSIGAFKKDETIKIKVVMVWRRGGYRCRARREENVSGGDWNRVSILLYKRFSDVSAKFFSQARTLFDAFE